MAITSAFTDLLKSLAELFSSVLNAAYSIVHSSVAGILGLFAGFFAFVGDIGKGVFDLVGGFGKFVVGMCLFPAHFVQPRKRTRCTQKLSRLTRRRKRRHPRRHRRRVLRLHALRSAAPEAGPPAPGRCRCWEEDQLNAGDQRFLSRAWRLRCYATAARGKDSACVHEAWVTTREDANKHADKKGSLGGGPWASCRYFFDPCCDTVSFFCGTIVFSVAVGYLNPTALSCFYWAMQRVDGLYNVITYLGYTSTAISNAPLPTKRRQQLQTRTE